MTRLLVVRHGNTFRQNETPRRVGARTDIPLVEMGHIQAERAASWLIENTMIPEVIYSSPLRRTLETSEIISRSIRNRCNKNIEILSRVEFTEIDYGVDENQSEEEVCFRLGKDWYRSNNHLPEKYKSEDLLSRGKEIIDDWNNHLIVPPGWNVNKQEIICNWNTISDMILKEYSEKNVLVVTSNGIARFAVFLTEILEQSTQELNLKLSTGALGVLQKEGPGPWLITDWNIRP